MPRLNRELKAELKSTLPLAFARPEDPLLGATLLGVLVRNGEAKVDDAVLHGRSDVERGIRFSAERGELVPTETWGVVFIAMKNGPSGLFYQGATAMQILIDRPARRGHRDIALSVNRMSEAVAGQVVLDDLPPEDRTAVAGLLEERGRDVWERTPEERRRAIQGTGS
ncbi:MAG: YwhD family protein [Thermaerobacter sp.]|nr:YwhD family protein [Thermaerobacter sp.]